MNWLKQDFEGVVEALAEGRQKLLLAAVFAITWVVYAVFTDIIVVQDKWFNPNLKLLDASLITFIAFLTSLLLAMMVFVAKNNLGETRGKKRGVLGSFIGVFATACPICQPIWLVWLGLGSQALFLVEISLYVQLASIALLLVSLHFVSQGISNKTCAMPSKRLAVS